MFDFYLRKLYAEDRVTKSLPEIIETFVEYYGEDKRSEIERRFKNMLIFCYQKPLHIQNDLTNAKSALSDELLAKIREKLNLDSDEQFRYFSKLTSLGHPENMPINAYIEFFRRFSIDKEGRIIEKKKKTIEYLNTKEYDIFKEEFPNGINLDNIDSVISSKGYQKISEIGGYRKDLLDYHLNWTTAEEDYTRVKDNAVRFLKPTHPEVKLETIEELEKSGVFEREHTVLNELALKVLEYKKKIELLTKYGNLLQELNKRQKELELESLKQFLEEFGDHINEKFKSNFLISGNIRTTFFSYLEAFSSQGEEIIRQGGFVAARMIKLRIEYFKSLKINLGDDYRDYDNSLECKKLMPPQNIIDAMFARKDELEREWKSKFYYQDERYKEFKQKTKELGLLGPIINAYDIEHLPACITPNIRFNQEEVELYPIFYMSGDLSYKSDDNTVFHELNHLYELSLLSIEPNKTTYLTGWDYYEAPNSNEEYETMGSEDITRRDYEMLNEIINELIAQELTRLHHKRGRFIINTSKVSVIGNNSSYENCLFLVLDFFQEFHSQIIESRKNGNMKALFDYIGEDNFNALNELIKDFFANFKHEGILRTTRDEIKKGIDSARTRKYKEFELRRDIILTNMRNYTKNKGTMVA